MLSRFQGLSRRITSSHGARFLCAGRQLHDEVMERCETLLQKVQPVNDRVRGPLERYSHRQTRLPFVFVLGNHSSGKSSFINYVLRRPVQTAGVAPTDDAFTVIAPAPGEDSDRDGPSLIGDPDMGFSGLRQYGPGLVHHTMLKLRTELATSEFMMVDSPGMIDSPVSRESALGMDSSRDRGYDFEGVVKWYADRADVILLFFDPDKPGTTGETLRVLTKSLAGLDHKLYIVLNKADQFRKIHDFARAYGSLCWNLSKVISRKDLPRIYTMCLPAQQRTNSAVSAASSVPSAPADEASTLGDGLKDLERTREDVVAEVFKAPKRRIDNIITRLGDSVGLLQMHCTVIEEARRQYSRHVWKGRAMALSALALGAGAVGGAFSLGLPAPVIATAGVAGVGGMGAAVWVNNTALEAAEERLSSYEGLEEIFTRTHSRQLAEGDEYVVATWQRVRETARGAIAQIGLGALERISSADVDLMRRILEQDIPDLRRKSGPTI